MSDSRLSALPRNTPSELVAHCAFVATDNPFQRRVRLLQALWRESKGYPIGSHRGRALGSRLAMPEAEIHLWNYLTDGIRAVVHREVLDPVRSRNKLFSRPRIFDDLLSSQPLCFNLFGELSLDLELASRMFASLTNGRVASVTSISFEHSPGRGDISYTGDRSAFDVFVEYTTADGKRGFVGIEVKYHEDLGDRAAPHRDRYDDLARQRGWWRPESLALLRAKPMQQMWRDHLLVAALLGAHPDRYDEAFFAFCSPKENTPCAKAIEAYRACVAQDGCFVAWTLEDILTAAKSAEAGSWVTEIADRYLALDVVRHVSG